MDSSHERRLHSIETALRAAMREGGGLRASAQPSEAIEPQAATAAMTAGVRFVTISRQAGAGGLRLATELVNAINRQSAAGAEPPPPAIEPWCAWDHDLVEKVASEHCIPNQFVEALEDSDHRWFSEFLASLSTACDPSELKVYRRVAMTIRALAEAGRAVIVGRGGVFITEGLAGGLHVRLVGPVQFRIQQMAVRLQISLKEAAAKVHEIDRNRLTFYRQHWPYKKIVPETFTLMLNTAELTEPQMVSCLLPLIVGERARRPQTSTQPHVQESPAAKPRVEIFTNRSVLQAQH